MDTQELRRLLWGPLVDTFHGAADRPISRNNQQSAGRRALTLAQASPFSFCWRSVVGSETYFLLHLVNHLPLTGIGLSAPGAPWDAVQSLRCPSSW